MKILFIKLIQVLFFKLTIGHLVLDQDHSYECTHSHFNVEEQISSDYFDYHLTKKNSLSKFRTLEAHNSQGIRITTDIVELNKIQNGYTLSQQQKNYITSLMESGKTYLNKLIKVYPRTSPIVRRGNRKNNFECIDVIPSLSLIKEGIDNSDLHILVTFEYNPDLSSIANAGFCELEPSPIIGRIKFNVAKMSLTQENFQQNLWTTLHELTHILGFSGNAIPYWIDPDTNKPYIKQNLQSMQKILSKKTIRGVEGVYVLHSKNVLEVARQHFGCQTLEGLPLENQGGIESFGSHWEKDLLQNEFMTASRINNNEEAIFSQFTAALLLDTGYYAEINKDMIQNLEFGKYKGCSFVEYPCEQSFYQFKQDEMCELNSLGLSLTNSNYYSDCQNLVNQSSSFCSKSSKYIQQSEVYRNKLGQNSKCFRSSAVQYYMINKSEDNIRCHEYSCSTDLSTIIIHLWNDMDVKCSYPNQIIDLIESDVETYGQITCPQDFSKFCSYDIKCPFDCHSKGFCNSGVCYCSDGQIGGNCSHLLTQTQSSCQEGFLENPDMTCRRDCPDGYFEDHVKRICDSCHQSCQKCFGKLEYQCLECKKPFYLLGQSCMTVSAVTDVGNCDPSCNGCTVSLDPNSCIACNGATYLNGTQCSPCMANCSVCKNGTSCTTCATNYKWNTFISQCELQCDITCSKCSAGNNPTACTLCFNGRYLDVDNSCKQCDLSCNNCSGPANNQCTQCKDGQFLDVDNTCKTCNPSCVTCNGPNNNNCLSCIDGKYLTPTKMCQSCNASCITCVTSATKCTKCTGSNAPDTTGTCYACDPSCLTCFDYTSKGCSSCANGYWVNSDNECTICAAVCTQCSGNSTICSSCIANYHVDSNNNCVPDCDPTCVTCSKPHDSKSCLTCKESEFVNALGECKPCNSPCFTCKTTPDTCTTCQLGYFLKPNSNVCFQSCYKDCSDCTAPADPNACISCNDGFYISGTNCLPCTSPCKTCIVSGTKCLSCISKTDYIYDKTANTCTPICDPSCKTCSLPKIATSCLTCFDGFFVQGGVCLQCQYPCKTCVDNQNKCTDCAITFELQLNNTCKQICHTSCVSCTKAYSGEFCKNCFDGSTLIAKNPDGSGLCRLCITPCKTCETGNENACTSCISADYQIDPATKKCVPICDPSCVTCYSPKNPGACLTCSDGKFLVSDQCRSCVPPCKNCVVSGYKCLSCVDKYSYNSSSNTCSPICHPTCQSCYLPDDPKQCKTCADNAYEYLQTCILCNDPCKRCQDNADKCLECVSKIYAYDKYKFKCINMCDKSCKMCSEQSDPNKCVSCNDGKYLTNLPEGACLPCKFPCLTCSGGESQCTSCAANYVPNIANPKQCDPICNANCLSCTAPLLEQYCIVCKDGLFKSGDKCLPCASPCSKCITSENTCLSCVADFTYDNIRNACDPVCDATCKTCIAPKNPSKCRSCNDGTFLNPLFQCEPCQSPCKTCEYEKSRCISCVSTQYQFNPLTNRCQLDCDPSCLDCSIAKNPNACINCVTGKYLTTSNTCQSCTPPCAQCETTSSNCKSCTVGYEKDPALPKCKMICHQSCKSCGIAFIEDGCSACPEGYFLQLPGGATTGKCILCDSPCKTCINSSTNCQSCISDTQYQFISSSGTCKPICDKSCQTCSEPLNPKACTSCLSGYFVNQLKQCQLCAYPCGTCTSAAYFCDSCASSDFTFDPATKSCINDCHKSCATCFVPFNDKQCKSCYDGFFLVTRTCQPCSAPCLTCETSSTQCTSCQDNYQLSVHTSPNLPRKCLPICHDSCSTCDQPLDQNSCLTCYPGSFYDSSNKSCQKCQFPNCAVCDKNQCIQCSSNYYIDPRHPEVGCQPICDSSCVTCSKPVDSTACLTCAEGQYISFGTCLPCKFPCNKCSSAAEKCLTCVTDYNWEDMKCIPICDSTCSTCSKPKDPKACITCSSDRYKDISNMCLQCKPGETVTPTGCISCPSSCNSCDNNRNCTKCSPGYTLNSVGECQIETQVVTCHFTCRTCVNDKYDACTSCVENRKLKATSFGQTNVGFCDCPESTTDTNKSKCENSSLQSNVKNTATGVFAATITVSALGSITAMNPILLFGMIEFSQTVSFFKYVNQKSSVGFDNVMGSLYTTHFTKLFDFSSIAEKDNQKRLLETTITTQNGSNQINTGSNHNTKIYLNDKYPTFLANALALLILSAVAWIVSLFIGMMEYKNYGSLTDKLQKIFCISFPLVIFVFSSQEYSLLCFYQYEFFGFNSSVNSASSIFSILIIAYLILFLFYLTYKLEYQRVLQEPSGTINSLYLLNDNPYSNQNLNTLQVQQQNYSLQQSRLQANLQQSKILPYETVSSNNVLGGRITPPEKQGLTPEQRKFYILFKFIKQERWMQRNYIQIMVVRKIICALITAYGFKSAVGQAVGLFILYLFFWAYIIFYNPFIQKRHRIMYCAIETILVFLHMLLIILTSSSDESRRQAVSLAIIIFVIITFIIYLAITFVALAISIYRSLTKPKNSTHIQSFKQIEEIPSLIDQSSVIHNQSGFNQSIVKESNKIPPALVMNKRPQHLLNQYQSQPNQVQNTNPMPNINLSQKQMAIDMYSGESPTKYQSKRVQLEPISNRGNYEGSNIQSGAQLYVNQQQSPSKINQHRVQFSNVVNTTKEQNNQSPIRGGLINLKQSNQIYQQQQQQQRGVSPSKLYNGAQPSQIYKDYY